MDTDGVGFSYGTEESLVVSKDTCTLIINADEAFSILDILIYGRDGVAPLEKHLRDSLGTAVTADTLRLSLSPGPKTAVVVANCTRPFNGDALARYDTAEKLTYSLRDEDRDLPLMTAVEDFQTSDEALLMTLEPLRCTVILESIEHGLPGYSCMEDPRMWIENSSATAVMLKSDGHRVTDALSDTTGLCGILWDRLPYDIGMYAQQPGTKVFCYPCDDEDSAVRPSVVIGCSIGGSAVEFRQMMPLLGRESTLMVSLKVGSSPKDYEFTMRKLSPATRSHLPAPAFQSHLSAPAFQSHLSAKSR